MSGHTPWSQIRRKARERRAELPPGPPADASLYDCDGVPVSYDAERDVTRAWDRAVPRKVPRDFPRSEGVSIGRERFDELRGQHLKGRPPD
jgi:hypothetical protein